MAMVPMYAAVFGYYFFIDNFNWLKNFPGDYDDSENI
jgi:hypothetical protein